MDFCVNDQTKTLIFLYEPVIFTNNGVMLCVLFKVFKKLFAVLLVLRSNYLS